MVPVAAKAGVLLAVAAAGSTSIWYFSDSIFGTSLVSVAGESDQDPYANGSIGKKYGKYFLSSKNNKKIWEARHKEYEDRFSGGTNTNKAKDKFSTVASAFSIEAETNNTTSLNKICEAAYKEADSSKLVDTDPTSDGTAKFFKPNVWEFCGLGKVVTLDKDAGNYSAPTFGTTTIGGVDADKKLFVSTKAKDNVNDWFWKLKTEEFWANTNNISGKDKSDNEFKKLSDKQESRKNKESIKNACEEAYKKETSTDNGNKNKEDALVFCSIKLELSSAS